MYLKSQLDGFADQIADEQQVAQFRETYSQSNET